MIVYDIRKVPLPLERPVLVYVRNPQYPISPAEWDVDEFYLCYERLTGYKYHPSQVSHWCELPPKPE